MDDRHAQLEQAEAQALLGYLNFSDGRPDPRPDVRENVSTLGNLINDFDFAQAPRPPMPLPVHPQTTLTGTPVPSGLVAARPVALYALKGAPMDWHVLLACFVTHAVAAAR